MGEGRDQRAKGDGSRPVGETEERGGNEGQKAEGVLGSGPEPGADGVPARRARHRRPFRLRHLTASPSTGRGGVPDESQAPPATRRVRPSHRVGLLALGSSPNESLPEAVAFRLPEYSGGCRSDLLIPCYAPGDHGASSVLFRSKPAKGWSGGPRSKRPTVVSSRGEMAYGEGGRRQALWRRVRKPRFGRRSAPTDFASRRTGSACFGSWPATANR